MLSSQTLSLNQDRRDSPHCTGKMTGWGQALDSDRARSSRLVTVCSALLLSRFWSKGFPGWARSKSSRNPQTPLSSGWTFAARRESECDTARVASKGYPLSPSQDSLPCCDPGLLAPCAESQAPAAAKLGRWLWVWSCSASETTRPLFQPSIGAAVVPLASCNWTHLCWSCISFQWLLTKNVTPSEHFRLTFGTSWAKIAFSLRILEWPLSSSQDHDSHRDRCAALSHAATEHWQLRTHHESAPCRLQISQARADPRNTTRSLPSDSSAALTVRK